ncbi:hypothetical protein COO60DRAFT_1492720 [Scenedesmus sp. NREL 46B-D3]|nr:hypothetical protein COO60DRAFT_1492720 [Scenedesmus sp. NREL 46B-D3]
MDLECGLLCCLQRSLSTCHSRHLLRAVLLVVVDLAVQNPQLVRLLRPTPLLLLLLLLAPHTAAANRPSSSTGFIRILICTRCCPQLCPRCCLLGCCLCCGLLPLDVTHAVIPGAHQVVKGVVVLVVILVLKFVRNVPGAAANFTGKCTQHTPGAPVNSRLGSGSSSGGLHEARQRHRSSSRSCCCRCCLLGKSCPGETSS